MINSNNLVYLCKEVFDENSEPTQIEIEEQASRLGIDIVKEFHLLSIVKQCLLEPLPSNWFPCNTSQWEHPLDAYYRQMVEKTRLEDQSTGQDISLTIILEEDNSLDTMYQTKNFYIISIFVIFKTYEKKPTTEKRTVRFKTPIEESLDFDNSDDNMKFLGPIKLNTPYTNASTTLQNLTPYSTTNSTFDIKNTGGRSVFSKYNILPNKDELSRKSDSSENIKQINKKLNTSIDYGKGKEQLRKIDITLTESSDRSESTSSEIRTENLNSDYEVNDQKEKNDDIITTVQINKQQEKNDIFNDIKKSTNVNFNEFQTSEIVKLHNLKKDDLVSDSGNSTEKDSKVMQSYIASNSFPATKSKITRINQQFPLNQSINDTSFSKIKPTESNENIFDLKPPSYKSNSEQENHSNINEKQTFLNTAQIKIIIENNCELIRNKLEDNIKTKENIFREEIIKKINDIICKRTDNFEKHMETQYNELFSKNESELKNIQEKIENSLIEECDKKHFKNVSNIEQICEENLKKFQSDLIHHAEIIKNKIHVEFDVITNELKKNFCEKSETVTDNWNQILGSYANLELEKIKNNYEKTTENIKRDTDNEICRFDLEFKEKLKKMSEDKLNNVTEQLDIALREEINLVKKRVNEKYQNELKINKSNTCTSCCPEQELKAEYQTGDTMQYRINYSDIKKKIEHCSNELNDALKLINLILSPTRYTTENHTVLSLNKHSVSCQTDNIVLSHQNQKLREYPYLESSNVSMFNSLFDVNTKYVDYWNQVKMSRDVYCPTPAYTQMLSPLDMLNQEELKVNAAEKNISRLIETFNNPNIYENKFSNIYQSLTPKQIAHSRTKNLREWLYKTRLEK
ncbi:Hypothetical protein CINCED_3A011342 [Cinara cedri]|uniref:Uncharacterized protein n=1 Tax=Cinara cedri TaxID=506608 RepID=A0A5E4MLG0_9HEMI|nr:Hypothetical protein CINCED_3A011342 [Cinara cedri]